METKTIAEVVDSINDSYLLPAIQREFVWDADQVVSLFDSIMRDYPIGALLLWSLSADEARKHPKYKFVSDYIEEPSNPPSITVPTYRNPPYDDYGETLPSPVKLVLDGQQRLTALNIGLTGSYYQRKHGGERKKADSWSKKQLYLNLLSDPTHVDSELGNKFDLSFRVTGSKSLDAYWYPVRKIMDIQSTEALYEERNRIREELDALAVNHGESEASAESKLNMEQNLETLQKSVHSETNLHFFTKNTTDLSKVRDIFIRINEGGETPNNSEILLSLMTSSWQREEPQINARDEVHALVDDLNEHIDGGNAPFQTKHIQKSLLTINNNEVQYRFENYDLEVLSDLKEIWRDPTFEDSMETMAGLLNSYYPTVSYVLTPALYTPVVYYLYRNGVPTLDSTSKAGKQRRLAILYFICAGRLNGFTGKSSNQIADAARDVLSSTDSNKFPINAINDRLRDSYGVSIRFTEEGLDQLFNELSYGKRNMQFLLQLVHYPDEPAKGKDYEIDHIIPASAFRDRHTADRVGNLQLLVDKTNKMKSDEELSSWITSRTEEYRDTHLIPESASELDAEAFINRREALIKDHILTNQPL